MYEIEMEEFAKKWYTKEVLECLYELGFEAFTENDRIIGDHDGNFDFLYDYKNGDCIGIGLDIGFNSRTQDYIGKGYELELQLKDGTFRVITFKRPEELIRVFNENPEKGG